MKTLLFIGHPGHELLAYKFLRKHKPLVVFLTTGSGNTGNPRIQGSIELLESLGPKVFKPFEPFTDRQIYNLIMEGNFDEFAKVKSALKEFIKEHNVKRIVGDALEGFNPSHDLCRYLINGTVQDLSSNSSLANYDFLQDEVFKNVDTLKNKDDIILTLDDDELQDKLSACRVYSQLKFEVDRFFNKYGVDFFRLEYFRKITNTNQISTWEAKMPFYEIHGRKRVEEGIYKNALLFEDHMKPLANFLLKTTGQ
ncbi:hypothetical protein EV198_0684 [Roseivirga ehrenbergii]|uniref:Uncharacterized protein n=1 Tax=Roseivirga ehrenbergii (strain DSM 102268 / JCM 13514 / KCTC 12282 / NCIMB 14502 / KMM 6017) TaxID=279360 RepID=A0A150X7V7_ROSEK|nr:hypothetical protein [Roseivirga ehrenbergii]KYG74815.1 hypothetical protein MB14_06315 [Roseivirga ehrenbergii]TCL13852.1 hypothetical protein EV198_0684 [Roseivirga ehrenbergii]